MKRPRLLKQQLICGNCLNVMANMESDSVDLVFGSPPYEDARTYGIDFHIKGQEWGSKPLMAGGSLWDVQ